MLAIASAALGFQGAALTQKAPSNAVSMQISVGDVGTTRPLGVWDPLNLIDSPAKYRRWQEMEIKHGRLAMAGVLHVIVTGAGYKWSGYASYLSFPPLKFEDIPAGTLGARTRSPTEGKGMQPSAACEPRSLRGGFSGRGGGRGAVRERSAARDSEGSVRQRLPRDSQRWRSSTWLLASVAVRLRSPRASPVIPC